MKRLVLFSIACACAAAAFALVQPAPAAAGWCWPNCSAFGFLGQSTSSNNGCWFSSGEVCSYYGAWFNMLLQLGTLATALASLVAALIS